MATTHFVILKEDLVLRFPQYTILDVYQEGYAKGVFVDYTDEEGIKHTVDYFTFSNA